MTGLLFVWRSLSWRSYGGFLPLFTFPFSIIALRDECLGLQRDLGYFMMVAFSQIFLGSVLSKGCIFSLLQPGEAQSATYLGFLWLTLKGISFTCLGPCLLSSIYAKNNTLYRGRPWKRQLGISQSGLTFPWVWRSNLEGKKEWFVNWGNLRHILSHLNTHKKPCKGGNML